MTQMRQVRHSIIRKNFVRYWNFSSCHYLFLTENNKTNFSLQAAQWSCNVINRLNSPSKKMKTNKLQIEKTHNIWNLQWYALNLTFQLRRRCINLWQKHQLYFFVCPAPSPSIWSLKRVWPSYKTWTYSKASVFSAHGGNRSTPIYFCSLNWSIHLRLRNKMKCCKIIFTQFRHISTYPYSKYSKPNTR